MGTDGPERLLLIGATRGRVIHPHAGLSSIQAYLLSFPDVRDRCEVRTLTYSSWDVTPEATDRLAARVAEAAPDAVGLSCFSWDMDYQVDLARKVRARDPRVRVVAGGPSATATWTDLLAPGSPIDVVVLGEGEAAMLDLVRRRDWRDLSGVAGVAWRDADGAVHEEAARPPLPMADLVSPYVTGLVPPCEIDFVLFTRGCVHRCTHCSWRQQWGLRVAPRARMVDELRLMRSNASLHGTAWVFDSALNVTDGHVAEVASAIAEADPDRSMRLSYFLHYTDMQPHHVPLLAGINTEYGHFGFESLNPAALAMMGRGPIDERRFARALELASSAIPVSAYVMLGIPGDTLEWFKKSADFLAGLARQGLLREVIVFWTILPAGSSFARMARRHGARACSPGMSYVTHSDTFPVRDMVAAAEWLAGHPQAALFCRHTGSDIHEALRRVAPGCDLLRTPGWDAAPEPGPPPPDRGVVMSRNARAALDRLASVPGRPLGGFSCAATSADSGWPEDGALELTLARGAERLEVRARRHPPGPAGRLEVVAAPEDGPPGVVAEVTRVTLRAARLASAIVAGVPEDLLPAEVAWRPEAVLPPPAPEAPRFLPGRGPGADDALALWASCAIDLAGLACGAKPVALLDGLGGAAAAERGAAGLAERMPGIAVRAAGLAGATALVAGRDPALVAEAADLAAAVAAGAGGADAEGRLGALLGYPPCCVAAWLRDSTAFRGGPEWLRLSRYAGAGAVAPFHGFLAAHVPCSAACAATAAGIERLLADPAAAPWLDRFAAVHSEDGGGDRRAWGGLHVLRFLFLPGDFALLAAPGAGGTGWRLVASRTSDGRSPRPRFADSLACTPGVLEFSLADDKLGGPMARFELDAFLVGPDGVVGAGFWTRYLAAFPEPAATSPGATAGAATGGGAPGVPAGVGKAARVLDAMAAHPSRPLRGFVHEAVEAVGKGGAVEELLIVLRRGDETVRVRVRPNDPAEPAYLRLDDVALRHDPDTPLDSEEKLRVFVVLGAALKRLGRSLFAPV
ncbi:MAG: cobalamin-dependent protein [Deltaproteobacteria bacterium]|nr:cobalamin-dependent protein [Deltaproteobacteria bacterium]